jgi:small GTP-binding protein
MTKSFYYYIWDEKYHKVKELIGKFPPRSKNLYNFKSSLTKFETLPAGVNVVENEEYIFLAYKYHKSNERLESTLILYRLDISEKSDVEIMKSILKFEAEVINKYPDELKKKKFLDYSKQIKSGPNKKIVFVGLPNSGKTSTKQFFFDKIQERKILDTTNSPTVGFETNLYDLMSLNISLFDTSGQELDRWMDKESEVFKGADTVIFFFSVTDWIENEENVRNYLKKLVEHPFYQEFPKNVRVFCHKADLIPKEKPDLKKNLQEHVNSLNLPISFTTIKDGGNFDMMNSFYILFMDYSVLLKLFNDFISPLYYQDIRPLFLVDKQNRVISNFDMEKEYIEEIEQLRKYHKTFPQNYIKIFNKKDSFQTFWLNDNIKIVICINMEFIYPEFSHLFLHVDRYDKISKFHENYLKLAS